MIIVPALVFFFGMSQQTASATSLMALLLPVGLLGVYEYYQSGKITTEHIWFGLVIALGLFAGALALLGGAAVLWDVLRHGTGPTDRALLLVALGLVSGVQLVFLGVLGEYLGAVLDEARGRPHYIVQERINFPGGAGSAPEA